MKMKFRLMLLEKIIIFIFLFCFKVTGESSTALLFTHPNLATGKILIIKGLSC
jgi:hypothetical protein